MRNRLESFKSAKMGIAPKTVAKYPKKLHDHKVKFDHAFPFALTLNLFPNINRGKKISFITEIFLLQISSGKLYRYDNEGKKIRRLK